MLAASEVRRLPVEGGLLLLDTSASRLLAFNEAARQVWDLTMAGRTEREIVVEFAGWWGIPAARAGADVADILAAWRAEGLLSDGGDQGIERIPPRPASQEDSFPPNPQWVAEWTCTVRGRVIAFAIDGGAPQSIRALFRHLETPGAAPSLRLEIASTRDGAMRLVADGAELIRTRDAGELVGALHQAVLEHIHRGVSWLALIHGAAVAHNGVAIGLPGPSGSGKSTLAAGLLDAGYGFVADDMIAVSAAGGAAMPWPLPLSIKPGSIEVVSSRHPALATAAAYRTKGLDARLLVPGADAWEAPPARLQALVFPRFVAGAASELVPLTPFEAMVRLLADRVWLGNPITEARATAFLAWLGRLSLYAMTHGGLDEAVRLVEGLPL